MGAWVLIIASWYKKAVREKVCYSPQHISRLEAQGLFPKRVRLGQGRVAWVEDEIDKWIEASCC
jgi:prophage regulatory protein